MSVGSISSGWATHSTNSALASRAWSDRKVEMQDNTKAVEAKREVAGSRGPSSVDMYM